MAETKMTKTQIINETFNFYKANPSLRGKNPKGNPETCITVVMEDTVLLVDAYQLSTKKWVLI